MMTVTNQINTVVYTGNGVTTQFDFSFRVDNASELEVILYTIATGLEETLDPSEYSVTGIGEDEGGSVTYEPDGSPMASTHKLILRRVVPLTQDLDVTAQDGFNPEIYEDQLDRMVMMIQQISEKVNRAATLSAANSVDSLEDLLAATLALADLEDEINTLAGIAANITTIAGISANVTTVAGVAAAVATLAGIASDISTVAANDDNVTALAAITASITTLAGIAANVTTLAALDSEIATLAGLDTELAAIYAALANIATVTANIANVNTVAGIDTEVTTLAGLDTELAAIYAALADIQAAAADLPSLSAKLNIDGSNVGDDTAKATFRTNVGALARDGSNVSNAATFRSYIGAPAIGDRAYFKARKSANQTDIAVATFTKVTWETEIVDNGGYFASSAWTPPAGPVFMSAKLFFAATNLGDQEDLRCAIFKNGVVLTQEIRKTSGTGAQTTACAAFDVANGTDVYEVYTYVTGGAGTKTVSGSIEATEFFGFAL